jgi:hypothetical protein
VYCQVEERDRGKLKTQNGNKTDCFISRQKVVEGICQYNTIRMGISSLSLSSRSVERETASRFRKLGRGCGGDSSSTLRPAVPRRTCAFVGSHYISSQRTAISMNDLAVQQLCGPDQSTLMATIHQRCLWRLHCCSMFVRILLVCRCWP